MGVERQGHRSLGLPVKLAANAGCADALPPRLSEHAGAILSELVATTPPPSSRCTPMARSRAPPT